MPDMREAIAQPIPGPMSYATLSVAIFRPVFHSKLKGISAPHAVLQLSTEANYYLFTHSILFVLCLRLPAN
jgi:hypothetical protein